MTQEEFEEGRNLLWNEIVHLHNNWEQYQKLYSHSKSRVQVLNACAPAFFAVTQVVLLRETILGISRLTDPPRQGGYDNLTLDFLLSDPRLSDQEELREELKEAIEKAKSEAGPIRSRRNKTLAHLDFATATGSSDEPLQSLSKDVITKTVQLIEEPYKLHNARLHDTHTSFDVHSLGDADALVRVLESSDRWHKIRRLKNLG